MVLARASPRYVTFVVVGDDEGAGDDDGMKRKYSFLSKTMEYRYRHFAILTYFSIYFMKQFWNLIAILCIYLNIVFVSFGHNFS